MNKFKSDQSLDNWVEMLDSIYGPTQNYNKSKYEIFSHLVEVVGAFGKYTFKKKDFAKSILFLPKMFSWALILFKKVRNQSDLRKVVLTKYPTVCYYCADDPCKCNPDEKPRENIKLINEFYRDKSNHIKSLSQFQIMFESIYEKSWAVSKKDISNMQRLENLRNIFVRLTEELSEMAEAMRFYHINESNFENEFADYFAWWIALVSSIHHVTEGKISKLNLEKFIWNSYPGYCTVCSLNKCDCIPGPVRELLSKPSQNEFSIIDNITLSYNSTEFDQTIKDIFEETIPAKLPITFIAIDLKGLGEINSSYGEDVGDEILRLIANTIRSKISYRYKLFRAHQHGDEFLIICQDFSIEEAKGMVGRIIRALLDTNYSAKNNNTTKLEKINITISVGLSSCIDILNIKEDIIRAKKFMYDAKKNTESQIVADILN